MSDKALGSLLTAIILAGLAVWVPFLEALAWLRRPQSVPVVQEVQPYASGSPREQSSQRSIAQA